MRPGRPRSATCWPGSCARSVAAPRRSPSSRPAPSEIAPGATGLLALDWFNGNRSILADADLTGVIFGLTLQSTPEQIYRALLESIAFANRRIMDNFTEHGIGLTEIVACGGIAERSPLTMQLFADVSGRAVSVSRPRARSPRGVRRCSRPWPPGCTPGSARRSGPPRPGSARTYQPDRGRGSGL